MLSRAAQQIVYGIRTRLYAHLHRLPLAYHQQRKAGDTLVRLSSDIVLLRDVLVDAIVSLGTGVLADRDDDHRHGAHRPGAHRCRAARHAGRLRALVLLRQADSRQLPEAAQARGTSGSGDARGALVDGARPAARRERARAGALPRDQPPQPQAGRRVDPARGADVPLGRDHARGGRRPPPLVRFDPSAARGADAGRPDRLHHVPPRGVSPTSARLEDRAARGEGAGRRRARRRGARGGACAAATPTTQSRRRRSPGGSRSRT